MTSQIHILVVDDDARIRSMLRRYLSDEGYDVGEAGDGPAMRAALAVKQADLVLLDLVLPGEDGFTLAHYIRQRSSTPIIMLTGKGDVIDKVAGLEAGADDYIAKPFHLREVLARIRTVLRRAQSIAAQTTTPTPTEESKSQTLHFEGWTLDIAKRELSDSTGATIVLTTGEFELLRTFAQHPNRVLERDTLMDLVKGREWAAYDRSIDAQVVRLRKKIERDPANPKLIKTVRGAGYLFTAVVSRY
jgi:two-component system phosphate regulon response regulator OmpR